MTHGQQCVSSAEFITRVLAGERNFAGLVLADHADLCGDTRFTQLQEYLKGADLAQQPLDLSGARAVGLMADGLHCPGLRAAGADLRGARLLGANLAGAVLTGAILRHACVATANLAQADFSNADLRNADCSLTVATGAKLAGADVEVTTLEFTNWAKADLRGIRNLDRARFTASVNYQMVTIGPAEKEHIRQALWAQDGRKLRLFGGAG